MGLYAYSARWQLEIPYSARWQIKLNPYSARWQLWVFPSRPVANRISMEKPQNSPWQMGGPVANRVTNAARGKHHKTWKRPVANTIKRGTARGTFTRWFRWNAQAYIACAFHLKYTLLKNNKKRCTVFFATRFNASRRQR